MSIIALQRGGIMPTVTIQETQSQLAEIIHRLGPGEEVVITENDRPVARILPTKAESPQKPRALGTMKGTVLYMAPDCDAPLEDFKQ